MMDARNNNKDTCLFQGLEGMVSGIVCEASRSNLGMLVEPLY